MLGPGLLLWRQTGAACTAFAGRPGADLLATAARAGLCANRHRVDVRLVLL